MAPWLPMSVSQNWLGDRACCPWKVQLPIDSDQMRETLRYEGARVCCIPAVADGADLEGSAQSPGAAGGLRSCRILKSIISSTGKVQGGGRDPTVVTL